MSAAEDRPARSAKDKSTLRDPDTGERAPETRDVPGDPSASQQRSREANEKPLPDLYRAKPRRRRHLAQDSLAAKPHRTRKLRHPLRRFLIGSLLVIAALIAIGAIAVQIILHTSVPRNIVIARLQEEFGLRIGAQNLSTGWGGHTDLKDVTLALPLADEAFFRLPELRVQHTNLLAVLLRRPLRISSIELVRPRIVVRQDPLGRWNVEEAVALLARASGGRSAAAAQQQQQSQPIAQTSIVQLPTLSISSATLVLVDRTGKQTEIAPLNARGNPQNPLAWGFNADV